MLRKYVRIQYLNMRAKNNEQKNAFIQVKCFKKVSGFIAEVSKGTFVKGLGDN